MSDLFVKATRQKLRFDSKVGPLTVEQVWDLPLTSKGGPDLDSVGAAVLDEVDAAGSRSLVRAEPNPKLTQAQLKLEVVKFIIEEKKAEAEAAKKRADKAAEVQLIREAIALAKTRELSNASLDELQKRLEALQAA